MRLDGDRLVVRSDLNILADVFGHALCFRVRVKKQEDSPEQVLTPGEKYDLVDPPQPISPYGAGPSDPQVFRAIPRKIAWGGGGLNLVTSIRDISPVSALS